jgi:hypothetical protein
MGIKLDDNAVELRHREKPNYVILPKLVKQRRQSWVTPAMAT